MHTAPHRFHATLLLPALLLAALLLASCGDDDIQSVPVPEPLEIAGSYTDEFGDTHEVTDTTWHTESAFTGTTVIHIELYSNADNYLLGQNDSANLYNPDLYSRLDWTLFNGSLYLCTTVFDAPTLEEAAAGQADPTDPTAGGCNVTNDFPWTNLTP